MSLKALLVNAVRRTVNGLRFEGKLITLFKYEASIFAARRGAKYFESELLLRTILSQSKLVNA